MLLKHFIYICTFTIVGSCATKSYKEKIQAIKDGIQIENVNLISTYSETITDIELKAHLYVLASEEFQGRGVGTNGERLAARYLNKFYLTENIDSPIKVGDYFQEIPGSYFGSDYNDSENVVAIIKGVESPSEVIIISAHYDHEGISKDGKINYGADDNSSGTSALLEIAQAFQLAKENGHGPKRSVMLLHTTGEEIGLHGSQYYSENPLIPLKNTVANLNIDMIGRVDKRYAKTNVKDYIYIIGADRLSTELHYISEAVNENTSKLKLDYTYNDENDSNRYYYRSDHYNFAKHNIPVVFYFNGEHEDYHLPTDTPDKIDYDLLEKRAKLIFATAWQLANQPNRIRVDKAQ